MDPNVVKVGWKERVGSHVFAFGCLTRVRASVGQQQRHHHHTFAFPSRFHNTIFKLNQFISSQIIRISGISLSSHAVGSRRGAKFWGI